MTSVRELLTSTPYDPNTPKDYTFRSAIGWKWLDGQSPDASERSRIIREKMNEIRGEILWQTLDIYETEVEGVPHMHVSVYAKKTRRGHRINRRR
jgi:hypothetical protein